MSETDATTPAATPATALVEADAAQLPAEVTAQVRKEGDLIAIDELTQEQVEAARKISAGFDFGNTISILTFAAEPQRKMSGFLDELLEGVKVKQAGVAGEISMELASGIDLMSLDKVKSQILHGDGLIGKIGHALHLMTNYVHAFYDAQRPVRDLLDKIERMANNRIQTLDADSQKLDRLATESGMQVRSLASWILAGEIILLGGRRQYLEQRERVLQTKDPLSASELRDMARQLAAFEKRLLEAKIAYVEAGSVTIPRVRTVQEAISIEIQNVSEQILFQVPKIKAAIVQVAALKDITDAQRDREQIDRNERKLDGVLDDVVGAASRAAKESQGSPLAKVEALQVTIAAIKAGIEAGILLEKESREKREQAAAKLVDLKNVVTDALKQSDITSAEAS